MNELTEEAKALLRDDDAFKRRMDDFIKKSGIGSPGYEQRYQIEKWLLRQIVSPDSGSAAA